MKSNAFWINIFCGSIVFLLLNFNSATAQVIPDDTLSSRSAVPQNCTDCVISGGTRSGNNLFHSFQQFSIPTGGRAYFNNAGNIQNIFARITGGLRSNIDGVIQANGNANLFILNPNGILFGANASLNLRGSFFAATAESIQFGDGVSFSTVNPQASSLLSISVPIGLQFGQNPGSIINRSQARPNSSFNPLNTLNAPVGLQVQSDQTLALIGNGIFLEKGNLTARGGQIELGSVAPSSSVPLISTGESYALTYANVQNFRDIRLSDQSYIDTSGELGSRENGGGIQLQGRNISIADSTLTSTTYQGRGRDLQLQATRSITLESASAGTNSEGQGRAGNVVVQANDFVELVGGDTTFNSLGSQTFAAGNAGNISINTGRLSVREGFRIEASTFSAGRSGNILIQAPTIEVTGFNRQPLTNGGNQYRRGQVTSGIVSQVAREAGASAGNAGTLTIDSRRLILRDGGIISAATFAGGDSGTLTVNAPESILISGASPAATRNQYRSGIFVSAEDVPGTSGNISPLNITTNQLTVTDRGEISANNRGIGNPGTARINVDRLVIQNGGEIRASSSKPDRGTIPNQGNGGTLIVQANSIQLTGTGTIRSETFPSAIAAYSESAGDAGDLHITTNKLNVQNGANISVSGIRTGSAGNLEINARSIQLDRGSITAATQAGSGAEITLQDLDFLLLENQSQITAQAFRQANGGNVFVRAPGGFVVAADNNNDILARAFRGNGGNITIEAQSILGLAEREAIPGNITNDIDASSDFGAPGSVTLNTPDVDPSRGLAELPIDPIDASQLISRNCLTSSAIASTQGEFVITGRSGLPPSPTDPRLPEANSSDWVTLDTTTASTELNTALAATRFAAPVPEILEAQGWIRDKNGAVALVAEAPAIVQTPVAHLQCPASSAEIEQ